LSGLVAKVCGSNMEDLTLVILVLGTFFGAIISAIYYKKSLNPVKKAQKRNEMSLFDNLTDYREVEKSTIADILKQKDNQIKSLNARIKQFEPLDEEDQQKGGVTWEEITALVQHQYPKYSGLLLIPGVEKQVMKTTKGMNMDQILQYVKQFTGNQQSEASPITPDAAGNVWRADYA